LWPEQKDNAIASKEAHKLTRQLPKEEQALLVAQRKRERQTARISREKAKKRRLTKESDFRRIDWLKSNSKKRPNRQGCKQKTSRYCPKRKSRRKA
jgi:hypothetical protein